MHSTAIWVLLLLLAFLPVYGPYMVYAEGVLLPVTSKIEIVETRPSGTRLDVRFAYTKYRSCELVSTLLKRGEQEIDFSPVLGNAAPPTTRLPDQQISRLWHVDAPTLDGLEMWFLHRCSPLWLTATQVMP